jgi:hypothetical protein
MEELLKLEKTWKTQLDIKLRKYMGNYPVRVDRFMHNLSSIYSNNAILEYLINNDIEKAKSYFYNAFKASHASSHWFSIYNDTFSDGQGLSMIRLNSVDYAVLSDKIQETKEFTNLFEEQSVFSKSGINDAAYYKGLIIKYIVEENFEKADIQIRNMYKLKLNGYMYSYLEVLNSIVERNKENFIQTINKFIVTYLGLKENKSVLRKKFCIPGTALVKIAIKIGLIDKFEHEVIPNEIVQSDDFSYSLPDIISKYFENTDYVNQRVLEESAELGTVSQELEDVESTRHRSLAHKEIAYKSLCEDYYDVFSQQMKRVPVLRKRRSLLKKEKWIEFAFKHLDVYTFSYDENFDEVRNEIEPMLTYLTGLDTDLFSEADQEKTLYNKLARLTSILDSKSLYLLELARGENSDYEFVLMDSCSFALLNEYLPKEILNHMILN